MICHPQGACTADTGGSKASEKALWPVITVFVWWSGQAAAGRAQVSFAYHATVCALTNVLQVLDISNMTHTTRIWCINPRLGHRVQSSLVTVHVVCPLAHLHYRVLMCLSIPWFSCQLTSVQVASTKAGVL